MATVVGSLSSNTTHIVLVERLVHVKTVSGGGFDMPSSLMEMISEQLFTRLTLRSLLNLCTACKEAPTAAMLAIALQNSVPSLTGLPMGNQDPAFYIDIAKRFFQPVDIPVSLRTTMYDSLRPDRYLGGVVRDLDAQFDGGPLSGLSYYVHLVFNSGRHVLVTKRGRDFIRGIVLEWLETPLRENMVRVYRHLLNVLDHGLVLRNRNLEPGCLGCWDYSIAQNEHE